MNLRDQIKFAIQEANGDMDKAAINVCKLLDEEVGLSSNGWFDNDPELLAILSDDD